MKPLKYFFLLLIIFQSCSKDSEPVNTPTPEIPPVPDTLSASWTKVNGFKQNFLDIAFANDNTGFVVGDSGLYKSSDGGYTWNFVSSRIAGHPFIAVLSASTIFSVLGDTLYKSFDGGKSFSTNQFTEGPLSRPYFININIGYLASTGEGTLFKTVDGGHTWSLAPGASNLKLANSPKSLFFVNENTGWAADWGFVYRTNGSTNSWSQTSPNSEGIPLAYFPFAVDEQTIFISSPTIGINGTTIFKSIDGGQHYTKIAQLNSTRPEHWVDLHFFDENEGYATAGKNAYKTVDGGNTWSNIVSLGTAELFELYFIDNNHGWACGTYGTILVFKK